MQPALLSLTLTVLARLTVHACTTPQPCDQNQPLSTMANPLQGLQQRPAAETLEYLGWAAAQMIRFSDLPEHAYSAVTAQALVDAGEVLRALQETGV
jgi:hypothetical protein